MLLFNNEVPMNHNYYKKLVTLSVFGEISETEKNELLAHVQECSVCGEEYEELRRLKEISEEALHQDVDEIALSSSREELLSQVRDVNRAKRNTEHSTLFSAHAFGKLQFALSLTTIIAFTIVVYFLAIPGRQSVESVTGTQQKYVIPVQTNPIFSDKQNAQTGHAIKDVIPAAEHPVYNAEKQQELAHVITNNKNSGTRLKTISSVAENKAGNSTILKKALIKALTTDDNPGVRKEAMLALANLPYDKDIQDALLFVLDKDKNSGLRVMAINYLDGENAARNLTDPKALDIIRDKTTGDDNSYVKIRAKSILRKIKV
jgi:hypothetical protein